MPTDIKGPAIFLAQFAGDAAPFNSWDAITKWAAALGYKGVQIPSWDGRLFDLKKAAESKTYCDDLKGVATANGVEITELSTHLQGQLVAVHPAYDEGFDAFAPEAVHGKPKDRRHGPKTVKLAAKASKQLGLTSHVTFSGALRLALRLFLAAAPAGPHRGGLRRACAALEAAARRVGREWRRRAATSSTPART